MIGLDISRGLSFRVKRRKTDFFLNSGGGCGVSIANMVSMYIDPTFASGQPYRAVQVQVILSSELSALEKIEEAKKTKLAADGVNPYISTSACRTIIPIQPAPTTVFVG